jgi:hypothetical protein
MTTGYGYRSPAARAALRLLAAVASPPLALLGCTTGEGEGWVRSDPLYVERCWDGPFDLQPTFFGGDPNGDSLVLRVQRGDNLREVSDGLTVLVEDLPSIRENSLGAPIPIGLPAEGGAAAPVSLSLYLHDTCHEQNGALYAISGTITFASLFSGDRNETDADDRLTEASFSAEVVNASDVLAMSAEGGGEGVRTSLVEGEFRFFFQRGQPAQPFP